MKPFHYRFEHIQAYQERKKEESESAYQQAVDAFEKVAKKLYHLLKEKEDLIEYQQQELKVGFTIEEIYHHTEYLKYLETAIAETQKEVLKARAKMEWYEEKLLEDTIEVKKYEKVKEKDYEQYKEEMKQYEAAQLDEMSTVQFSRKEQGW